MNHIAKLNKNKKTNETAKMSESNQHIAEPKITTLKLNIASDNSEDVLKKRNGSFMSQATMTSLCLLVGKFKKYVVVDR